MRVTMDVGKAPLRIAGQQARAAGERPNIKARVVRYFGLRGVGLVKARASGRPGPRVRTGDYRRSINVQFLSPGHAVIGTNAPQALRLEFGFYGADRLGRVYAQDPFPHWRPAADQLEREFAAANELEVARAMVHRGF